MTHSIEPLPPLDASGLFGPLGARLVALLESLDAAAWQRPTMCGAWAVRDVVAHLLDTGYRRLSFARDAMPPPPPPEPIDSYDDLVAFLDGTNRVWIEASRRLSPRVLTELIRDQEPRIADWAERADLDGEALFGVAWAGEESSTAWFDLARELTERWLHQQQIRLAVGAAPLDDPPTSRAIFDTFVRVLPHAYRETDAADGTELALRIEGRADNAYRLVRLDGDWCLGRGPASSRTVAWVTLPEAFAWRLLTSRRVGRAEAADDPAVRVDGDESLAAPLFDAVAVMA